MTTAAKLRQAIECCARDALRIESDEPGLRARSFVARLSGSMCVLGERDLDRVLCELIGLDPQWPDEPAAPTSTTGVNTPC